MGEPDTVHEGSSNDEFQLRVSDGEVVLEILDADLGAGS